MAAVFDSGLDPAEIKHRVAESQSKLRAVAQDEHERNVRLLQVLEGVEKTLRHNQQQIHSLEKNRDRAVEEFRHLRALLQDKQTGSWRPLRRCFFRKSHAARDDLIARLDGLIFAMTEGDKAPGGEADKERGPAPPPRRRGLVPALFIFVLSLPAKALGAIFGPLGSLVAESLMARKAHSGMPLYLVRRKRTGRWAGGADVRVV